MAKNQQNWPQRFTESLNKWATIKDDFKDPSILQDFLGSIDDAVDEFIDKKNDEDALCVLALRALLHQRVSKTFREIEQAWGKCESSIEAPMLFAFSIVGRELGWAVMFKTDGYVEGDCEDDSPDVLIIEPQAQLGEHRVDFLLSFRTSGPDFDRPTRASDGSTIPGVKEAEKKMIVECDGHDYHDRTKDQAKKDRSRDRFLQSLGYRVFRYTGSEIWRDVFNCVYEALTTLSREADKEIYGNKA